MSKLELFKDDPEVIAVLDAADYWEWRTSIEETKIATLNVELNALRLKVVELELRNKQLEHALFKNQVQAVVGTKERVEKEYQNHIKKIEEKYNINLKECIIGDINYEVRKASK